MRKLSDINSDFLASLDPDFRKALRAVQVRNAFARAVEHVFRGREVTRFVLEHVQAVYVMRDTRPYKKGVTPDIYLYIYSSDSTVRSELDMRQDWIRLALAEENIHYDRVKIYASKLGMKKRKPFEDYLKRMDDSECGEEHETHAKGIKNGTILHEDVTRHSFNEEEIEYIARRIEDANVRKSFLKLMRATRV